MAKILVVDDEKDIRGSIRMVLKRSGHDVLEAADGIEAEELLVQNAFDLVITDIIMPNKEGLDLIIDINKSFPDVKIIAMSGCGVSISAGGGIIINKETLLEDASMLGADDTLNKPFEPATLLQSVEDCLSGKKKRR